MSNKKILIVEDDADVRLGYKVLLFAQASGTHMFLVGGALPQNTFRQTVSPVTLGRSAR